MSRDALVIPSLLATSVALERGADIEYNCKNYYSVW